MIRILFTDEARADTLNAFAFYEERRPGLGERFREHVDLAISKIQNAPLTYPLVYRDVRRKLVERFPYAILYRIYPGVIAIVALMHGSHLEATGAPFGPWLHRRPFGWIVNFSGPLRSRPEKFTDLCPDLSAGCFPVPYTQASLGVGRKTSGLLPFPR